MICPFCGEPFIPQSNRQIFCCPEHRYKYKKNPVYKYCEWCGEEYLVTKPAQRYCCPEHSEAARLDHMNKYVREYRRRYTYMDMYGVKHRLYPCKMLGSNTGLGPHRAETDAEEERLVKREMRRIFSK